MITHISRIFSSKRWLKVVTVVPFIVFGVVALLIVYPQIKVRGMVLGADSLFHIQRLYDTAMQISHHNFSYFQTNYGFQQSARIVNALYGPYFAYFMGIILLMSGTWINFQIVTSIMLIFCSSTGMYLLCRRSGAYKSSAVLSALLFSTTGWLPAWITGQEFTSWGTLFMPFVLICGVRMVMNHSVPVRVVPLALSVTLIVQVHMLSSIFAVVTLIPFFIVGMQKAADPKKMFVKTIFAAFITLLMTANVWGAMINVFGSNHLISPYSVSNMGTVTLQLSPGANSLFRLGLFPTIIALFQISYVVLNRSSTTVNRVLTYVGAIFLLCSTNFLPWESISKTIPALTRFLQFPARLQTISMVLLWAGVSLTLTSIKDISTHKKNSKLKMAYCCIYVVSFFGVLTLCAYQRSILMDQVNIWFSAQTIQRPTNVYVATNTSKQKIRDAFSSKNLSKGVQLVSKGTSDYLPQPAKDIEANKSLNLYQEYTEQVTKINPMFTKKVLPNGELEISWKSKSKQSIQLPVIGYNRSYIKLNGRRLNNIELRHTNIGAIIVPSNKGKNKVIISYQSGIGFHILLIVSMLSIVFFVMWYAIAEIRRTKMKI